MKRLIALAIAGVLLAGCAAQRREPVPGQYKDYRQMVTFWVISNWQHVPSDILLPLSNCVTDTVWEAMTPEERAKGDAYARAEIKLSDAEVKALDRNFESHFTGDQFDAAMQQRCPDTIKRVQAWRAQNS